MENILSQSEEPLSVKQISDLLTQDDQSWNDRNLKDRIRRSLNYLVDHGRAQHGDRISHGHINSYTYTNTTYMSKDKSFLRAMRDKSQAAQAKMMANMAKPMIPALQQMFVERVEQISKPADEGGILKDNETHAGYWVSAHDGQLIISECALTFNEELGKMVMSKPVSTKTLQQILTEDNDE